MLTNLVTLLIQMYLTNFGSLAAVFTTSVSLFGISVVAKSNMSRYDRLFVQNVVASLLFHCLNYINPRIKDEVIPQGLKFIEGLTSMNLEKIKSAVLYNYQSPEDISNNQLMAMAKGQAGVVDMEKLTKVPKTSFMAGPGHSFASSTVRDMQNAGQASYDQRYGGINGMGGMGSGTMTSKDDLARMYSQRGSGTSSSIRDYTMNNLGLNQPNYNRLGQIEDNFSFILDNNLL
jgi:hypothetical protein